ncbi:polysaccharide export protein [Halarchaeum grantii]|uniref:Polysaccharide export protein n=1 Tax=Halarchaeum grantii TaxID=1193105 RepID=A0A830F3U3_9EURY|nr:polysaccharide biosynthesis C-terminal domain-containing protein [Halarchaeum grantii]GGL36243.1 polysaccharide export protein [Halarchaeum grantii]
MSEDSNQNILSDFLRDFGIYSVSRFAPTFLGFIALIAFTHFFDTGSYGRYALTTVFITVFATGLFDWLKQAVLRFDSGPDNIIPTTLAILLVLLATSIILGIGGYIIFRSRLGAYRPFYIAGIAALTTLGTFEVCRSIFQARLQSKEVMKYQTLKAIIRHGLGLGISLLIFNSIVGWVWAMAIGCGLAVVLMISQFDIQKIGFNKTIAKRLTGYGFPMLGWLFGLTLLTFIDRVLLEYFSTASAVGIYSANYTLIQTGLPLVLAPVIEASHPVIMQEWNGENHEKIADLIARYSRYFLILGIPATIFAAVISRPLSILALGTDFRAGYVIIPIIAVSLFIWNFAMIGHKGLEVQDETGLMSFGIGLAVLANIVLNYIAIPLYGFLGAAVATLISTGIYTIYAYLMSIRTVQWEIPKSTVFRVGLSGLLMSLISGSGYLFPDWSVAGPVISGLSGGIGYLALLILLGEFDEKEIGKISYIIDYVRL